MHQKIEKVVVYNTFVINPAGSNIPAAVLLQELTEVCSTSHNRLRLPQRETIILAMDHYRDSRVSN